MVVDTPKGRVYYEFKSVKNLPPGDFLDQFGKDLFRPDFSIDNLRWVFDGRKITRQDLEKLKKPLLELSKEKWATLFEEELEELIDNLLKKVFIVD